MSKKISVTIGAVISEVNQGAMDWARDHAGERLGTKWYDGESSTEPSEKWPVSESVRLAIREIIAKAFSRETPMNRLVEMIQDVSGFSDERAQIVADTEIKFAHSCSNLDAWKKSGVVKSVRWITSSLHDVMDECDSNRDASPIPLGEDFPSGVPSPPAHIGCCCSIVIAELNEQRANY